MFKFSNIFKRSGKSPVFKDENRSGRGKTLITGALLGVALTLGAFALFAFLMLVLKIDRIYAPLFATLGVSLGAFVSAFYVGKKLKAKGLVSGLVTGFIFFISIFAVSLFADSTGFTSNTAFHFVIILLSGAIGGIFGANRR